MMGAVTGSGDNVGGLVGNGATFSIRSVTITSSSAKLDSVTGSAKVGGLVGDGSGAMITSSSAEVGAVTGSGTNVGGLVGSGSSATITSSSAEVGAVTGSSSVGGLAGSGSSRHHQLFCGGGYRDWVF